MSKLYHIQYLTLHCHIVLRLHQFSIWLVSCKIPHLSLSTTHVNPTLLQKRWNTHNHRFLPRSNSMLWCVSTPIDTATKLTLFLMYCYICSSTLPHREDLLIINVHFVSHTRLFMRKPKFLQLLFIFVYLLPLLFSCKLCSS